MSLKRGDIHWVDFPKRDPKGSEIEKTRPCVILSLSSVNNLRRTVVVVPLTSSPEPVPPVAIAVPSAGPDSVAVCDQVTAMDKRRVKNRSGSLSARDLQAIEQSVRLVLGL